MQSVRNRLVEGTLLVDRPAFVERHLHEDAVLGAPDAEIIRIDDEVIGRMLRDDLEAVVPRGVELCDHGLIDDPADRAPIVCRFALYGIDTCERHDDAPWKYLSF